MKLSEIANDLEQRRIAILKDNAQRAKQRVKVAQARMKMKKAEEELRKSRTATSSNLSLMD
jgi:16S rRNA C967 or C1407 C5-methylase (RsmB/RsmF family)